MVGREGGRLVGHQVVLVVQELMPESRGGVVFTRPQPLLAIRLQEQVYCPVPRIEYTISLPVHFNCNSGDLLERQCNTKLSFPIAQ